MPYRSRRGMRYKGRRRLQQSVATAVIPRSFNPYAGTMDVARPKPRSSAKTATSYKPKTYSKRSIGVQAGTSTDVSQMSRVSLYGGRKPKLTVRSLAKEVQQRSETTVYRFQGLKSFDDNGYFFCNCGNNAAITATDMPCYIYDLTGIVNVTSAGGAGTGAQPLRRASWNNSTSNIQWTAVQGLQHDGTTLSSTINVEKRPWNSTLSYPHEKSRLLWTDVKMNLWGCTSRPTEWTIQLVKFVDENLDPWNTPTNQVEHTTFWQSQLKHYVYNPIATTSGAIVRRGMKVLKTYQKIINPGQSTDSDPDPNVITLKMFNKWYRDLSYKNAGLVLDGDIANTILAPDFSRAVGSDQCKEYTDTRHKIFLLIRAKVFQRQDSPTINNISSPSFDLVVRTCHETQ